MARYKYSENSKEVTDIYFDTETHGEFMGMEQGGDMKKVTTARIKEKLLGEIVLGVDWQQEVLTMTSTPPVSPTEGDRYIVGASATGDWTGYDDYIAEYASGAWVFLAPQSRMGVFSYNDMYFLIYLDGEWQLLATLDEITELRDEVQGYRDEILNNPGFQAVSADLLGDDNIGAVATSLAIITAVHNNATNINTVATNNSNVTTVATSISAVNAVATDLGLGASSLIKIVADNIAYVTSVANNITNVNTVAGLSTEITALGARTTEIDALYAELGQIAVKENTANKKTTLAENSDTYFPTQKAVNDGLATKLDVDSSGNITPTGIFLGGTSSANYLDDYEEGTFTPTAYGYITAGTCNYTTQYGRYIRIGNIVYIHIKIGWSGHSGTGDIRIGRLPFTSIINQVIDIHPVGMPFTGMVTCQTLTDAVFARSINTNGSQNIIDIPVETPSDSEIRISGTYIIA